MLNDSFIPVAIDQWYERRQKDAKGEFYRKIAGQGPRNDFQLTTQGHYACDAAGKLYGFNGNHIDLTKLKSLLKKTLTEFDSATYADVKAIEVGTPDSRFNYTPPEDGLVCLVLSKVLGGYEEPKNVRDVAFQKSVGQDTFWIQTEEKKAIIKAVKENGEIPQAIKQRIARFHLVDNTRGEPSHWTAEQIESMTMEVADGVVTGSVKLETEDGKRGYAASLYGHIETTKDSVTRFDLVAEGEFFGQGPYTRWAPKGKFPLAITFKLVDGQAQENQAIPQGAKGWLGGYYNR